MSALPERDLTMLSALGGLIGALVMFAGDLLLYLHLAPLPPVHAELHALMGTREAILLASREQLVLSTVAAIGLVDLVARVRSSASARLWIGVAVASVVCRDKRRVTAKFFRMPSISFLNSLVCSPSSPIVALKTRCACFTAVPRSLAICTAACVATTATITVKNAKLSLAPSPNNHT